MSNKTKGSLYIIASAFSFAMMTAFVRLAGDVPSLQKAFFRNFVTLIIIIIILLKNKQKLDIRKCNIKDLVMRAFMGTAAVIAFFSSIDMLPLADSNILNKLSPFVLIILASIFLGEKIKKYQLLGVIVAFAGTYIVVRPDFSNFNIGYLIGIVGSVLAALAYFFIRKLAHTNTKPTTTVFCFALLSSIAILIGLKFRFEPMNIVQLVYLCCTGLFATIGQIFLTNAYLIAKPKDISVFDYTQIIFAGMFGYILFKELPDIISIIGYIVIISAGVFISKYNKSDDTQEES